MIKPRGYFGIGIYHPKTEENIGTLWRSAYAFGANFIFTIGRRYTHQVSDTVKAPLHIPLFSYTSLEEFESQKPWNCLTVCVELHPKARSLARYVHPERAVYLLGAEDYGLPEAYLKGKSIIQIEGGKVCLNVSIAGSIIMYDRISKADTL